jgi:hypothetical protein
MIPPVRGDLALAQWRGLPLIGAPVIAEVVKTRTFSGPKGSAPTGTVRST